MKTSVLLSGMAVLAIAGSAMGQTGAAPAATLKMRVVPVDGAAATGLTFQNDATHNDVLGTDVGAARTRRFSIQYQIQEGAGFEGIMASLASMQFTISASVAGGSVPGVLMSRAILTRNQATAGSVNPATASDVSGLPTTAATIGVTGLHNIWRGGLSPATAAGNNLPSNGLVSSSAISLVTPLTLSQRNQFPDTFPGAWFGLFDYQIDVADNTGPGDATVTTTVSPVVDSQTQNAWGGYEDGDVIPRTSRLFMTTGASYLVNPIPAPGSLALIGLGGLIAARRRRA